MTYDEYKTQKELLYKVMDNASDKLKSITGETNGGLTPDFIKESSEYKQAKREFNIAFENVRRFNKSSPEEFMRRKSYGNVWHNKT